MKNKLTYLIIHCTATPEGRDVTSDEIRNWHTSPVKDGGRGWKQVGYSDMFHINGSLENLVKYNNDNTVDPWEITNGAKGVNEISRHVVYVGGLSKDGKQSKDTRTKEQLRAMQNYIQDVVCYHPNILIAGHNQFANKACPSFDVPSWLRSIGVDDKNIYKK